MQKLAETENSLVRWDIIGELTRQEEPLAEQAKKQLSIKVKQNWIVWK